MAGMLENNNFSVMRTDIFDEETKEHFLKAVDYCKGFIDTFDTEYRNIMFCGTVGTGKSFLIMHRQGTSFHISQRGIYERQDPVRYTG